VSLRFERGEFKLLASVECAEAIVPSLIKAMRRPISAADMYVYFRLSCLGISGSKLEAGKARTGKPSILI